MADPDRLDLKAHTSACKKVRYTTWEPGDDVPVEAMVDLTREARADRRDVT